MKTIQVAEFVAEEVKKHIKHPYSVFQKAPETYKVVFRDETKEELCSFLVQRTSEFAGVVGKDFQGPVEISAIVSYLSELSGLFSLGAAGKN